MRLGEEVFVERLATIGYYDRLILEGEAACVELAGRELSELPKERQEPLRRLADEIAEHWLDILFEGS